METPTAESVQWIQYVQLYKEQDRIGIEDRRHREVIYKLELEKLQRITDMANVMPERSRASFLKDQLKRLQLEREAAAKKVQEEQNAAQELKHREQCDRERHERLRTECGLVLAAHGLNVASGPSSWHLPP